jgi:hypothetical protein
VYKDYQNEFHSIEINNKRRKNKDTSQQQDIMISMSNLKNFQLVIKKTKFITVRIVEMIALDYQYISILKDYGFKRLMAVAEDRYFVSSRKLLSQKLIDTRDVCKQKKKLLNNRIKIDLENIKLISFTFDLWSNKLKLKNKTLGCSHFPGEHTDMSYIIKLKIWLQNGTMKMKIVTQIYPFFFFVTDNARNISSALSHNGSNFEHILCTAHTLQLAIDDAVKLSKMTDLLKLCKAIITLYNHSDIASE